MDKYKFCYDVSCPKFKEAEKKALLYGDWDSYSRNLAAQFLSKQSETLIRKQLNLSYNEEINDYTPIKNLINLESINLYKCNLKSINLPDWIDFTWSYIFDSSWLTGIVIPWSIKDIWNWAFNNCTALAEVTIMEWVETIPYRAFRLTPITHIELPNSIKSIEQEAFSACSKLSSIYIWPNIENIVYVDESHAYTAFHECTNLKSIYIDRPKWFLAWWPWWADNADIYRFWNFDYSPATNTSWNVLAYLTGYSDNIQISNNSWLFNYIFTNNWDFTFRLNEKYDKNFTFFN